MCVLLLFIQTFFYFNFNYITKLKHLCQILSHGNLPLLMLLHIYILLISFLLIYMSFKYLSLISLSSVKLVSESGKKLHSYIRDDSKMSRVLKHSFQTSYKWSIKKNLHYLCNAFFHILTLFTCIPLLILQMIFLFSSYYYVCNTHHI